MFTGLIERTGHLLSCQRRGEGRRLTIRHTPWENDPLVVGESIAVQGACLTVTDCSHPGEFGCDVLAETLTRTTLRNTPPGALLNLERAVRQGDRLGGHIVSGHVDGQGTIQNIRKNGTDYRVRVHCPDELAGELILKGSIALDGISLTVAGLDARAFDVCIIPHTWAATSLNERRVGDEVNLETDVLGKYVKRYLSRSTPSSRLNMDTLRQSGFLSED